jgi:hypothetical protein
MRAPKKATCIERDRTEENQTRVVRRRRVWALERCLFSLNEQPLANDASIQGVKKKRYSSLVDGMGRSWTIWSAFAKAENDEEAKACKQEWRVSSKLRQLASLHARGTVYVFA